MKITVTANCEVTTHEFYRVQLDCTPDETQRFRDAITRAYVEEGSAPSLAHIGGCKLWLDYCAVEDGDVLYANGNIDDAIYLSLERYEGTDLIYLDCFKVPEGDDRNDPWAFHSALNGKLPDNFWIEPAHVIRNILAA